MSIHGYLSRLARRIATLEAERASFKVAEAKVRRAALEDALHAVEGEQLECMDAPDNEEDAAYSRAIGHSLNAIRALIEKEPS